MRIKGVNVKGIKETVGKYNKMSLNERMSFNIWFDYTSNTVMLIRNDIFDSTGMNYERYVTDDGHEYLRFDDISDIIKDDYPYLEYKNISMAMLVNVISVYLI